MRSAVAPRSLRVRLLTVTAAVAILGAGLVSPTAALATGSVTARSATSASVVAGKSATHVTLKKVSSSRLAGTVTGAAIPKLVTVWVRPAGSSVFSTFGKVSISRSGTWHLTKPLRSGTYKATTAGTRTSATSTTVSFTKPVTKTATKPTTPSYPAGASAVCNDGTYSYSAHRQGTCSWHGGVSIWL